MSNNSLNIQKPTVGIKRYLFFAYPNYYPMGGAEDFVGDYNSFIEIGLLFEKSNNEYRFKSDEYMGGFSIIDTETREIICFQNKTIPDNIKVFIPITNL